VRSYIVLTIALLITVSLLPFQAAAADMLPTKFVTVLDFDKVHQALDYVTGGMVPSGGDFWIADRTPNAVAHNWEGGGNTEGIIDMGLKKFDEVTEAPATGYQTDAVAQGGHTYVTSSPGKGRYGKFYIDDILRAGDRPGLTITEFSIRYAYQPNGSRNLVTSTAQPPPPPPSGCNWTGTWDTYDVPSLGGKYLDTLYFQQVGNQLTVTYKNYTYRKIVGTISGNILTGTWGDSPPYTQGIIDITMSTDCNSITGRWRWPSSAGWEGTWVGTRQSVVLPPQPPTGGGTTSGGTIPAGGGLYENYRGSPDVGGDVRMNYWHGQTFTALSGHPIGGVKLMAYRIGYPGSLIVSIRATDAGGHPAGPDLATGSTGGDTLPVSLPGEWREITFPQSLSLTAGSRYAIVARAPGGGGGNAVKWMTDSTAPDYTGGNRESSGDSGASWQSDFNSDYLFEIWGTSSDSGTGPGTDTGTNTDTDTGTSVVTGLGTKLVAESKTAIPSSTIQVPIFLNNASNIGSMNFVLTYNPQVLRVNKVDSGSLLTGALFTPNYQSPPEVRCGVATSGGVNGSGTMAYIEFQVIGTAGSSSPLTFSELSASTTSGQSITVASQNGTVTVASDKLKGDYNGDGKVTEVDALAALRMSVKLLAQDLTLDMNGDGKLTAEDARLILKKALGK